MLIRVDTQALKKRCGDASAFKHFYRLFFCKKVHLDSAFGVVMRTVAVDPGHVRHRYVKDIAD
ncbi:hypothetical protein D3C78_1899590 [compost metagenome]